MNHFQRERGGETGRGKAVEILLPPTSCNVPKQGEMP